jgi:hypothetical protein
MLHEWHGWTGGTLLMSVIGSVNRTWSTCGAVGPVLTSVAARGRSEEGRARPRG